VNSAKTRKFEFFYEGNYIGIFSGVCVSTLQDPRCLNVKGISEENEA